VSAETSELDGIPVTMLVAASGRALSQSECPELGFDDPAARRILAAIGVDARLLEANDFFDQLSLRFRIINSLHRALTGYALQSNLHLRLKGSSSKGTSQPAVSRRPASR
jgi:hypothetical protein